MIRAVSMGSRRFVIAGVSHSSAEITSCKNRMAKNVNRHARMMEHSFLLLNVADAFVLSLCVIRTGTAVAVVTGFSCLHV